MRNLAWIEATSKNEYDITCKIDGLQTTYQYNDRTVQWWYGTTYKGERSIPAYASSGGSLKATGLTPGTTYTITANLYNGGSTLLASLTGTATTKALPPPPKLTTPAVVAGTTVATGTSIQFTIKTANAPSGARYYMDCYQGNTVVASRQSSTTGTFTWNSGIVPNTQYTFQYWCEATGYVGSELGVAYQTTPQMQTLTTPAVLTDFTLKTENSISLRIASANAPSNVSYTMICILNSVVLGNRQWASDGRFYWEDLPEPDTQYKFDYYATAPGYYNSPSGTAYASTFNLPVKTPQMSSINITSTSISFTLLTEGAYEYTAYYSGDGGGGSGGGSSETGMFSFSGLTPNTTYTFTYNAMSLSSQGPVYSSDGTKSLKTKVDSWQWNFTAGEPFSITANQWLLFLAKIDQVRALKGKSVYGFTRTSSYFQKGEPFYHWMFTQASSAIRELNTSNVPITYTQITSGNLVKAEYFNVLRDALNAAI